MHACMLSHVSLFASLCTVACQAPLSMGFFQQGYWSGLPFPDRTCITCVSFTLGLFTAEPQEKPQW